MNKFIDGKLYRLMQKADLDDSLILELDSLIRNNPEAMLSQLPSVVKNIIKTNDWNKKMEKKYGALLNNPYWNKFLIDMLKGYCNFNSGEILFRLNKVLNEQDCKNV